MHAQAAIATPPVLRLEDGEADTLRDEFKLVETHASPHYLP